MKIDIWSDIACPWCYVGKRRFEKALGRFEHRDDVEVVWHSFELDPSAARTYAGSQAELLAAKYGVPVAQAEQMNARMAAEAKKEGLDFDFEVAKPGNTFDAHRLIHLAASMGRREAVVERFFRGYLTEGAAIGDPGALLDLATDAGLEGDAVRAVLGSDRYAEAVRADEAQARAFGIGGVPFFAIDEKYGVSGAQAPDVLLAAMQQAHRERAGLVVIAGESGDACGEEGCAI
jgi:predicted DsbA family dithiol-disulfide isomerase